MTVAEDRLDATFTALADPTRRAIVAQLARGDATVNELAAPFDMTLPGVSKHLKVLDLQLLRVHGRHIDYHQGRPKSGRHGIARRGRRAGRERAGAAKSCLDRGEPARLEGAFRQARRAPARPPASTFPATERNGG